MIVIPKSARKVIRKKIFSEYPREEALKVLLVNCEIFEKYLETFRIA